MRGVKNHAHVVRKSQRSESKQIIVKGVVKMKYLHNTLFVFATALLMVTSTLVEAKGKPEEPSYDAKSFNGNACQPRNGTDVDDFRWYVRGIMNVSSEYREISCPLVRDDFMSTGTLFSAGLVVRNNTGDELCCTLYSIDLSGLEVYDSSTYCTTFQGVSINTFDGPIGISHAGYYGLHCNLPPSAWIHQYQVMEMYPTDDNN